MQKDSARKEKIFEMVVVGAVTLIGLLIRSRFMDNISDDWWRCWEPWLDAIQGDYKQLRNYPGDYNLPYVMVLWLVDKLPVRRLYAVKCVSILFDYVGAIGLGKLAASIF